MKKNVNEHLLDPFAPVAKVQLQTPDGQSSSKYAVMLETPEEPVEVGVVGPDYQLIENSLVVDMARDILERSFGGEYEDRGLIFDGRKFRQRWVVPVTQVDVNPSVGDVIRLSVDVMNSYDGSTTLGLEFNAERLVCTNGMRVASILGGFRFRHYGGNGRFQDELNGAVRKLQNLGDGMERLGAACGRLINAPLTRSDTQKVFSDLKVPNALAIQAYQAIEEDTRWGLYNAFTHVLTADKSFANENWNGRISDYFLARNN